MKDGYRACERCGRRVWHVLEHERLTMADGSEVYGPLLLRPMVHACDPLPGGRSIHESSLRGNP